MLSGPRWAAGWGAPRHWRSLLGEEENNVVDASICFRGDGLGGTVKSTVPTMWAPFSLRASTWACEAVDHLHVTVTCLGHVGAQHAVPMVLQPRIAALSFGKTSLSFLHSVTANCVPSWKSSCLRDNRRPSVILVTNTSLLRDTIGV